VARLSLEAEDALQTALPPGARRAVLPSTRGQRQMPKSSTLRVGCLDLGSVGSRSGRITRHFHEQADSCQVHCLVVSTLHRTADQREARLASSLSFLGRSFVRPSIQPIADQREAHNAAIPNSNHRFALLPSALFVELLLRCQLGVLDWKRVLPSRSRTECRCFQRCRSWRRAVSHPRSDDGRALIIDLVSADVRFW
jgi:hypothetical protein